MKALLFTKTHEWLREEEELVCIGITEHAQQLLGDMVFVELPEVGQRFAAGDLRGVVESVKAACVFYARIDGEVVAVNESLMGNPALVNREPLGAGWLVKMRPASAARAHLLDAQQYQQSIQE
ncbi:MAG: glycine cleavage system protein GcvH [Legionellaceae bacterium]|nr:glycine cleavage system protein GcvH [Legionellaceae bacterium]